MILSERWQCSRPIRQPVSHTFGVGLIKTANEIMVVVDQIRICYNHKYHTVLWISIAEPVKFAESKLCMSRLTWFRFSVPYRLVINLCLPVQRASTCQLNCCFSLVIRDFNELPTLVRLSISGRTFLTYYITLTQSCIHYTSLIMQRGVVQSFPSLFLYPLAFVS